MQNVEAVWKNNFLNQVIVSTAWAPGSRMPVEQRVTVERGSFLSCLLKGYWLSYSRERNPGTDCGALCWPELAQE